MQQAQLNVTARKTGIKSELRKMRIQGLVPANIYGPGHKNSACALSERELRKIFSNDFASNIVLTLESASPELKGRKVIVKDLERHPLKWNLTHVDLYEVAFDRPLTVSVPVKFVGTPTGVKDEGGILQIIRRTVLIRGLLADLPEAIEVDISALKLGESLHISDAKFSSKIKVLDSLQFTLVSVVEAEKEEVVQVAAPVEGAAAAAGTAAATGTAAPAAAAGKAEEGKGAAPAKAAGKAEAPAKK